MEPHYGCVKLRAIEVKDRDLLKQMINSQEEEYLTMGFNPPISDDAEEAWIRNYRCDFSQIRWMIELTNGATLGTAELRNIDWKNRACVLGIKTNMLEKRRIYGDMKDALYRILEYAFDDMGLHRVECEAIESNIFSLKLCHSLGFIDEGIQREKIFIKGNWNNVINLGLLNQDFIRYADGGAPWQKKRGNL